MSALIAYSGHSLWQQTFEGLHPNAEGKVVVFSKLPEFMDFLHQVDAKLLLLELSQAEVAQVNFGELCDLEATKVALVADKLSSEVFLDERVAVIEKPVDIKTLKTKIATLMSEIK